MSTPTEPISGRVYPPIALTAKPGQQVFQNPPFHPNILNVAGGNTNILPSSNAGTVYVGPTANPSPFGNFQRGKVTSGGSVPGSTPGPTFACNFLYNPSTIYENRAIDLSGITLPAWQRNAGDPLQFATGLATNISFDLLFDRTFDLWDKSYKETTAGVYGVRADIEALYNVCGINQPTTTTATTTAGGVQGPVANQSYSNITVQGPMLQNPMNLFFAPNNRGALAYYGFINSLAISWSHFSSSMTPMRCTASIQFTALPTIASNYTSLT